MKQNEIEIPIYRAKLNIEDLARGNNIEDYLHKVIRHYVNRGTIMKDGDNYYAIGRLNYYNEIEVFDNKDKQILKFPYFENTISINFPDMLDSKGNKIFASLSEDGKGGDIVQEKVGEYYYSGTVFIQNGCMELRTDYDGKAKNLIYYTYINEKLGCYGVEVIGIQE